MTSELLVAGAANLDRMMYVERIPEQGETIMALDYEEHPGGKGANQAVAAALWGMKVNFIGRTGDDEPGKILKNSLGMQASIQNTFYRDLLHQALPWTS